MWQIMQISIETEVAERKKQEEFIYMLQVYIFYIIGTLSI
jgi:hypothetical protein